MAVTNPTAQVTPMMAMMGPDVARQQYELAQNQRYADILMQQALMEQPQGQMVSGHYVPPSPIQGLGQLLKAYVARKSSDLIPEKQAQLAASQNAQIQNMFGLGGGVAPAQARDMALTGGAMQGDVGPTNTNAVRMNNVQTGTGAAMPIPAGMDARTAMMQYMINPQAYATALATHSAPTEVQKIASASGFAPGSPQYQALMRQNLIKQNYIAPTSLAPGAGLVMPGQTAPSFYASQNGIQNVVGPNGQVTSSLVPGYADATGTIEQTQAFRKQLGTAGATPATRIDLATGNTVGTTQADVMGLQGNPNAAQPSPVAAPKEPIVTGLNPIGVQAGQDLNKQWISETLNPTIAAGNVAKNAIDNIRILKNIDLKTGFGTDMQKNAANILASLGVENAAKFATNAQIFESKVYESLVDTLSKQKGPQTEKDFTNIQKTYAQLKNTPQANQFLLDVAEAKAQQDQRKSGYYQKAASMPELRNNLSQINNAWESYTKNDSIFDVPLTDRAGNKYTIAQRYGIK